MVEKDASGKEATMLIDRLTTNHTYFMREPVHFHFLKDRILPVLKEKEKHTKDNFFIAPNATILIVDDNSVNRTLIKSLLKRTKIEVDHAAGGRECLEITNQKKYDIILMDHMMPELDGVETLHLLRADESNPNQNTVVIALTANVIAGCREMYLEYGFDDYFSKPIQAEKLEELIYRYLPKELVHKNESFCE